MNYKNFLCREQTKKFQDQNFDLSKKVTKIVKNTQVWMPKKLQFDSQSKIGQILY